MIQSTCVRCLATPCVCGNQAPAAYGCIYEARSRPSFLGKADRVSMGADGALLSPWCRTHGWDCPNVGNPGTRPDSEPVQPARLKVVEHPARDLRDIPSRLRSIADQIEAGKNGVVHNVAYVMDL